MTSFQKIASGSFVRHSDGSEFKIMDNEPAPYAAGAGAMAPSGIASYLPSETSRKKKTSKKDAVLPILLGKMAYVGSRAQITDTTATQLKYETTSSDTPDNLGYNEEESRERHRRYLQAKKGTRK